jgi:hypothetical protein
LWQGEEVVADNTVNATTNRASTLPTRRRINAFGLDVAKVAIGFCVGKVIKGRLGKAIDIGANEVSLRVAAPLEKLEDSIGFTARANWDDVRKVFGSFETVVGSPAANHPTFKAHQETDWRPALDFAAFLRQVLKHPEVVLSDSDAQAIREKYSSYDHTYFGGPNSHVAARRALGYVGTPLQLIRNRNHLPLRWEYTYNVPDLYHSRGKQHEESYEYVAGKLLAEPNWEIFDCQENKRLGPPKTTVDHFIESDYLLITKLVTDRRIDICVGGTHGLGTSQFGKLLLDGDLLKDLAARTAGMTQFQALFKVTDIDHDHASKRSVAGHLGIEGVAKI